MSNVSSGSGDGGKSGGSQPTSYIQMLRQVYVTPGLEGLIGGVMAGANLPAAMRLRLLSTVAPASAHPAILAEGLRPRSMLPGVQAALTPKIGAFDADAFRRIFLGGFTSSTVYSNSLAMGVKYPGGTWVKQASKNLFQCGFLFMPTMEIFRTPLIVVVPEPVFIKNFMKDDFSIVKVLASEIFGKVMAPVPGAYKSVPDYVLAPRYFLGSSKFSPKEIVTEAMTGGFHSPWRFVRGSLFSSVGACIVWHAYSRFTPESYD